MGSVDIADVVRNVVHTFESDTSADATQSLLRSMQSTTITSVIKSIRDPPLQTSPNRLLRALWSDFELRQTILTSLAEGMASKFTDIDASLLEEIDFLLIADARNPCRAHDRRLKDISLFASSIAKQSKELYSPVHGPLLVYCARAAGVINTMQARDVRTKILQFLLLSMCDDENIAVQAVIALLENELELAEEEEKAMMNMILRFVSTHCLEGDLPDVLRAILFSLTKTNSTHKAYVLSWLVFVIIQRAAGDVLIEVINVVDVMVLDSEVVCDRIANAFWSILNYSSREEHSVHKRFRFSPSHVAVLYCILSDASSEAQQEYLYFILERILLDPSLSFDISTAASSSASAGDQDFRRKAVFVESIKILAMQNRCQTILEFYEGLLWKSKKYQQWGSSMLLELFVWAPESRRSILNTIFGTIVQTETADYTVNAFCALYEEIASTPRSAFALRECQEGLREALELVSLLPVSYDCRILKASVPIFVTCPNLTDSMVMYLRKAAGSRSRKFQVTACTGLLTTLKQDNISQETAQTCSDTLKLMMETTDITVKSYLIVCVLKFLRTKPEHAIRISALSELLMRQFVTVFQSPTGPSGGSDSIQSVECSSALRPSLSLSIANCFGQIYGEYILKEPISLLAKFCFSLSIKEERMVNHMERYVKYLGNESGALLDSCLVSTSKAPILPRVKTLCEQFDVLLGTGDPNIGANHYVIYGLGLIVRDHLEGKSQQGSSENSKQSSSQPPQFASMTAREATSRLQSYSLLPITSESITFEERIGALKAAEGIPEDKGISSILKKKVCVEVLRKLLCDLKAGVLDNKNGGGFAKGNQMKELVLTLCSLYTSNCLWLTRPDSVTHPQSSSNERRNNRFGTRLLGSNEKDVVEQTSTSSELYRKLLSHPHVPNDVRKAVELRQLEFLGPSFSVAIRHSVMSTLITLCSLGFLKDEMKTFAQLFALAGESAGDITTDARRETSIHPPGNQQDEEWSATVGSVVQLVLKTIRIEFANSMSVGLTLAYMELVSLIIQMVRGRGETSLKRIGTLVFNAITDILREYSVRHITVLREMLRLCLKCLERSAALEFTRRILVWLGNSSSLLNSRFSVDDIDDNRLKVMEFDPDIIAEGMALDADVSDDDSEERGEATGKLRPSVDVENTAEVETHKAEKRASKSAAADGDQSDATQDDVHRSTQESGLSLTPEDKSVTSLCLDETAEVGLLSIVTVLGYCQEIVSHDVHEHRYMVREERDSVSILTPTPTMENCSVQIANILRGFCNTSFAKLVSPKQQAWPDVLVKKIDFILCGLLESAELKLRLVVKAARRDAGAGQCASLFRAALSTLQSLYDESTMKSSVFATAKAMSRLNKVSLEERLRTTSLEVSQVVREKPEAFDENTSQDWKSLLKNLSRDSSSSISRALGTLGKEASSGVAEHIRVSHPRKRQRLRSRNSGIDDWLQDERGDDNYADLEDFIVPMDATEL